MVSKLLSVAVSLSLASLSLAEIQFDQQSAAGWAKVKGFAAAFRTFEDSVQTQGTQVSAFVLDNDRAQVLQVAASEFDEFSDYESQMQAFSKWVSSNPERSALYATAFPTFETIAKDDGVYYELVAVKKSDNVLVEEIPATEVGSFKVSDAQDRVKALSRWAVERYPGAFAIPTYEDATLDNGDDAFGAVIVKGASFETVSEAEMNALASFRNEDDPVTAAFIRNSSFKFGVTQDEIEKILNAHRIAIQRFPTCSILSQTERDRTLNAYQTARIQHRVEGSCNGATNTYSYIRYCKSLINNTEELGRTALHEMVHVAGYGHPGSKPSTGRSCTNPQGWYKAAPLRAECCMPGGIMTVIPGFGPDLEFGNGNAEEPQVVEERQGEPQQTTNANTIDPMSLGLGVAIAGAVSAGVVAGAVVYNKKNKNTAEEFGTSEPSEKGAVATNPGFAL